MEDKINKIWYQMNMKEITSEQARQQVLDLFAVSGRSELLVCDMCGSSKLEECGSNEYSCEECGHFPITN